MRRCGTLFFVDKEVQQKRISPKIPEMNTAMINLARLLVVTGHAFRRWVESKRFDLVTLNCNLQKKSFWVEKTSGNPNGLKGCFPNPAFFQAVKRFICSCLQKRTPRVNGYSKNFLRFAYRKIPLAYHAFLLVSNGPAQGQVSNAPELYYFVVDRSGSIVQNKLVDPIRGAIVDFIGRRSSDSHVEIVFFNDAPTKPQRWTSMEMRDKGTFVKYFQDNFRPGGGTRLYDTVAEVIGRVAAETGKYRQIHVVILSDGDDPESSTRYRSWNELCQLIEKMRIDRRTTTFSWYTLGFTPKNLPSPDCLIKHLHFPSADKGFTIAEPPPSADFVASPMKVRVNEPVLFVLDNEARVSKALWRFGDGNTSSELRPRHSYRQKGNYPVSVVVEGPGGNAESQSGTCVVEVLEEIPLEAKFKWSPRIVRVGEEVTLVDESLGSPTRWNWSVPGLASSTERNPIVKFTQPGPAGVELIIEKDGKRASVKQTIEVLPQPPDASFSVEPMQPEVGTVFRLRASTTDAAYRHRWTIADAPLPEEKAEVQWKVDRHGRVEIVHAVEGPGGLTEKESVVFVPPPLEAKFSWQPRDPHAGETVSLRDESTGDPTTWSWDIERVGKKSERHPEVVFPAEGEYAVTLTVEKNGRKPSSLTRTIKINPKRIKPDASFVATPRIFTVGTKIQLTASHDHPGWTHDWIIDRTNKLSGPKVEWTATRTGEVLVAHRVSTPEGTDEKTEILLGKAEIPLAKFSATPIKGAAPLQVRFKNESSGEIVAYEWDFGDGQTSTEKDPVHTYRLEGTAQKKFTPTLTVKNRAGDTSKNTEPVMIEVYLPPPWWRTWKSAALVLLLVVAGWLAGRFRPRNLYGTLRWRYRGQVGERSLNDCGRSFDLSCLGLQPLQGRQGEYVVRKTKARGLHLKRRSDDPIPLMDRTRFTVEGIDFEYVEM